MSTWTADDVKARLEEAGATLFALPSRGLWPAGYRVAWPAMAETIEDHGWDPIVNRLPAPPPDQIDRMDEADRWVNELVSKELDRRILRARSLVNPRSGEPIISWRKIAVMIHKDATGVMRAHGRALARLADKMNEKKIPYNEH
jgi:hypothetical protein